MSHVASSGTPIACLRWLDGDLDSYYGARSPSPYRWVFEDYSISKEAEADAEITKIERHVDERMTWKRAVNLYSADGCRAVGMRRDWRHHLHAMWNNYFLLTPAARGRQAAVARHVASFGKRTVISFLVRHPALTCEQPDEKMPRFEDYVAAINEVLAGARIPAEDALLICATDSQEAYEFFSARYSTTAIVFPPSARARSNASEAHHAACTPPQDESGERILAALDVGLYLAAADHFVHAVSNVATVALFMNPVMTSHYIGRVKTFLE